MNAPFLRRGIELVDDVAGRFEGMVNDLTAAVEQIKANIAKNNEKVQVQREKFEDLQTKIEGENDALEQGREKAERIAERIAALIS